MGSLLRVAGAVLIVSGAVVFGLGTGAFDQVIADRDASASVAAPDQSYLAVSDVYGGSTIDCEPFGCLFGGELVVDLENRFLQAYTVDDASLVTVVGAPDGTFSWILLSGQISEGESTQLYLYCSGDVTANGTADLTFEFSVSGDSIEIDGARRTITGVDYDCE